jgi:hypothetical protein
MTDLAVAAILARRAELAAELEALERRAAPIRADIFHLDAALAILGRPADARRMRAQHRPAWVADLGRLVLDILRGAPEPLTARATAAELLRLAGHDAGDKAAVKVVEGRVRASLTRRVGIVERVGLGTRRKGWRVAQPQRTNIAISP